MLNNWSIQNEPGPTRYSLLQDWSPGQETSSSFHIQFALWRNVESKKYLDILMMDPVLAHYISPYPSFTSGRSKNLWDLLICGHYSGSQPEKLFGSTGPRWGYYPWGKCSACPNLDIGTNYFGSSGRTEYQIPHMITCNTVGVVYYALCQCGFSYVGLTSQEFRGEIYQHELFFSFFNTFLHFYTEHDVFNVWRGETGHTYIYKVGEQRLHRILMENIVQL